LSRGIWSGVRILSAVTAAFEECCRTPLLPQPLSEEFLMLYKTLPSTPREPSIGGFPCALLLDEFSSPDPHLSSSVISADYDFHSWLLSF